MQVSVETIQGLERRLTMSISREKLDQEVLNRLKSLALKVKLDGFRPGKVPFNVVKSKFAKSVRQEVLSDLMQSTYFAAINQEKLRPAGFPSMQLKEGDNNTAELEVKATFEVYPEIQLQAMASLTIERPNVDINADEVERMIETIRQQRVSWIEVDREARDGDRLTVDFAGKVNNQPFSGGSGEAMQVEIGSKRLIPGFEEQCIGLKVGETRDLNLQFPESYHVNELAGKPVVFHVELKKLEAPELPALDEAFVKSMGVTDGNLATFRDQVRSNMAREAAQSVQARIKTNVMDTLLEQHPLEVPKTLVDSEIAALMEQRKKSMGNQALELKAELFEQQARRRVRLGLILSEVIQKNDIKVGPAKLRETVEAIAAGYEHPAEVVKYYYSDKNRLAEIENFALEQEVVHWVLNNAKVSDKPISFKELIGQGSSS